MTDRYITYPASDCCNARVWAWFDKGVSTCEKCEQIVMDMHLMTEREMGNDLE